MVLAASVASQLLHGWTLTTLQVIEVDGNEGCLPVLPWAAHDEIRFRVLISNTFTLQTKRFWDLHLNEPDTFHTPHDLSCPHLGVSCARHGLLFTLGLTLVLGSRIANPVYLAREMQQKSVRGTGHQLYLDCMTWNLMKLYETMFVFICTVTAYTTHRIPFQDISRCFRRLWKFDRFVVAKRIWRAFWIHICSLFPQRVNPMMIGWSKAIQLEWLNMIFHQDDMDFWMKSDMSSL